MPTKKFCVMTIGRTGSTSLMYALEKFDDIALPSRDTDCVDSELLHPDRIKQYMHYYQPYAEEPIEKPVQLINAFYDSHADDAYAGFKSMPNRHPNYMKFITRDDIKFITLIRRDVASTVASFLMAMETGSWRRSGGEQPGKWRFDPKIHGGRAMGNIEYVLQSHLLLQQVPNAIRLGYEGLCDPGKVHTELNEFFGRSIKIDDPKPPTSGESYVENWEEFRVFITNGAEAFMAKLRSNTPPIKEQA